MDRSHSLHKLKSEKQIEQKVHIFNSVKCKIHFCTRENEHLNARTSNISVEIYSLKHFY